MVSLCSYLYCFVLLFQEIWHKLLEGIGLHLYGKFSLMCYVFLELWLNILVEKEFFCYVFSYSIEYNSWDLKFLGFIFCMVLLVILSKMDTKFQPSRSSHFKTFYFFHNRMAAALYSIPWILLIRSYISIRNKVFLTHKGLCLPLDKH